MSNLAYKFSREDHSFSLFEYPANKYETCTMTKLWQPSSCGAIKYQVKKEGKREEGGSRVNKRKCTRTWGCNQREITLTWRMGRRVWWKCKWMRRASRCFRWKGKRQKKNSRSFAVSCKCIQFRRHTPSTCRALREYVNLQDYRGLQYHQRHANWNSLWRSKICHVIETTRFIT